MISTSYKKRYSCRFRCPVFSLRNDNPITKVSLPGTKCALFVVRFKITVISNIRIVFMGRVELRTLKFESIILKQHESTRLQESVLDLLKNCGAFQCKVAMSLK